MGTTSNHPISYNKQTPRELMMFTEMIAEVYWKVKNPTWSKHSDIEIGFSIRNKKTKSNLFFGIWYEAWESFGIPMSFTLDYADKGISEKYNQIKKHIENKKVKGLIFKHDYQGFALVLVDHDYYNFKNDEERLLLLFNELTNLLEISN